MSRMTRDEYFLQMASLVSERATCSRRKVGCVLVNRHDHVVATGRNGVPSGVAHCVDKPEGCPGSSKPSGVGLDGCLAVHAEANALLQCKDTQDVSRVYVTCQPCFECMKMLCNTSAMTIVFGDLYATEIATSTQTGALWVASREGRVIYRF